MGGATVRRKTSDTPGTPAAASAAAVPATPTAAPQAAGGVATPMPGTPMPAPAITLSGPAAAAPAVPQIELQGASPEGTSTAIIFCIVLYRFLFLCPSHPAAHPASSTADPGAAAHGNQLLATAVQPRSGSLSRQRGAAAAATPAVLAAGCQLPSSRSSSMSGVRPAFLGVQSTPVDAAQRAAAHPPSVPSIAPISGAAAPGVFIGDSEPVVLMPRQGQQCSAGKTCEVKVREKMLCVVLAVIESCRSSFE